jgi:hypothetical protein
MSSTFLSGEPIRRELLKHGQGVFCRITGIGLLANLALVPGRFSPAARTIARAYAYRFSRPANAGEWVDLGVAVLLWPVAVLASMVWLTLQNGGVVRERYGPSRFRQCCDQLKLAFTSGLLPPWYYIFELYRPGELRRARGYLTHGETKRGTNRLLASARRSSTPLGDKEEFAHFCLQRQLRTLPVLFSVHDGECRGLAGALPKTDLFIKPARGRGGRGAERWDHVENGRYANPRGEVLSSAQLIDRLRDMSRSQPYLVQPRALNHPAIGDLTNGALSTVRMISCLNEQERPEIIGAVLRMAIGVNVTVDNVHAGGIAAAVDLNEGRLGEATHAGVDARPGWLDRHPTSGAVITGRVVPMWKELCDLVERAHSAFADWVVVGWDVAILAHGPALVEGNNGPDVDLIQRPLRTAFGDSRLGELIALHLDRTEGLWRT